VSKVFVITGPSGVGKGTLIARLRERVPELELSVSATTRAPRAGEENGRDYHFLEPEEFDRLAREGAFLEHATFSGNRYGTLRADVEGRLAEGHPVVLEIEVQGARQVRRRVPDALLIFVAPPSAAEQERRLRERGEDEDRARQRLAKAAEEAQAAAALGAVEVVNDDLDRAVAEIAGLIDAARRQQA
jgi:guanylate kinase